MDSKLDSVSPSNNIIARTDRATTRNMTLRKDKRDRFHHSFVPDERMFHHRMSDVIYAVFVMEGKSSLDGQTKISLSRDREPKFFFLEEDAIYFRDIIIEGGDGTERYKPPRLGPLHKVIVVPMRHVGWGYYHEKIMKDSRYHFFLRELWIHQTTDTYREWSAAIDELERFPDDPESYQYIREAAPYRFDLFYVDHQHEILNDTSDWLIAAKKESERGEYKKSIVIVEHDETRGDGVMLIVPEDEIDSIIMTLLSNLATEDGWKKKRSS